jgi:hypothetical protein
MPPFLLDPGCADLLTSDAFRGRYLSQVAPPRKGFKAVFILTIPLWPAMIVALVGLLIPSSEVLIASAFVAFLGLLPFSILVFAFLRDGRQDLRLRHLAQHGRLVEGRLISCKERTIETDSDGADPVVWSVDYEVQAPSGEVLRRTAMRDKKPPGPVPPAGTPVVVLMLDEHTCDLL